MPKLAILGGEPTLKTPLHPYSSVAQDEIEAVTKVLKSGCLSGFYGSPGKEFYGGPQVHLFEELWAKTFKVKHAITVNSATSGLFAAMGAIGVSPGDEIIVPPYTMSATAMAPLIYGGIPRFVDIEPDTFCLDIVSVAKAINEKTKAILAVNLFGHPAHLFELKKLAKKHQLFLVEDNAQAPLAKENDIYTGTIGDIGIFSLNYHKHIHCGEGGVCATNDEELAKRLHLIRNHGENVVEDFQMENITNLVGFNYRLTEMSAAVGIEQVKKIEEHVFSRADIGNKLSAGIEGLEGIVAPKTRENCTHVYYVWALRFKQEIVGVSRELFCKALEAEGFPCFAGYVRPLYLLPIFQKKVAIGSNGFPFSDSKIDYSKGLCPVTEKMHEQQLIGFEPCAYDISETDLEKLLEAFHKVYNNRHLLAEK